MARLTKTIENFVDGLIDKIEPKSIPEGSAQSSLNFLTLGDRIELRRGFKIMGSDEGAGGECDGVFVAKQDDGTEIPFRKIGRKLQYYDSGTEAWVDCQDSVDSDTNIFPADAVSDEIRFAGYSSLAGVQVFISSPNSGIYKIMVANPGYVVDLNVTTYRGYIAIHKSRLFLWNRKQTNGQTDKTGLYLSHIDEANYTTVNGESIGTGDGATTSFNETLDFKASNAEHTCFGIVIKVDGTVKFTDDYNGNLIHVDGEGSGTINYATGEITLSFDTAPGDTLAITADYQHEDSTDGGLADFAFSATRVAGEGDVIRQDQGGEIKSVEIYDDTYYCMHETKTFTLNLSVDDTDAENQVYRERVGIPNHLASKATGDGIYYVDDVSESEPVIRLLTYNVVSEQVTPESVSEQLDLTDYRFDRAWVEEWGDYILIGCRTSDSNSNNRVLMYNRLYKAWGIVDYFSSGSAIYDGSLILGDSISDNVMLVFSEFDDNDSFIYGEYIFNEDDLGSESRLKKNKKMVFEGDIAVGQIIDVSASFDNGAFVLIGQIRGDGAYVDTGTNVSVGGRTMGRSEVGGGGSVTAYHYLRELKELSRSFDKFKRITIKLSVGVDQDTGNEGIGYFSCSMYKFSDIRVKEQKEPEQYRV